MDLRSGLLLPVQKKLIRLAFYVVGFHPLITGTLHGQDVSGVAHFHRVDEHVYRGAQPSAEGLKQLSNLGVVTILDLRPAHERSDREKREAEALHLQYINIPLHNFSAPPPEVVEQALTVLGNRENWPVFVHCKYGVDRTGTVIACYRIQASSWPNERAEEEAEELGMHRFERAMKRFILDFQPTKNASSQ